MSKSSKRTSKPAKRSRRENTDRSATTDIVTQLECAVRHPQATAIGAVIGGVVPWFARTLAHEEVPSAWSSGNYALAMIMIAVVLGCACFSALTVYKFGRAAFADSRKALGFVLAIEGVMLVSHGITSAIAMMVLIVINAVANGSVIALARDATCRRRDADARGAATRAATRARGRAATSAPVAVHAAARNDAPAARRHPISVVDASTAHASRAARAPGNKMVRWSPMLSDDVIDAEIVREERLLS